MHSIRYGRMTQHAIAAMSYLAQAHGESRLVGTTEIAKARRINRPLVAKVLTRLAAHHWVSGTPGPGGGYRLASEPVDISLYDIASTFEDPSVPLQCPFGPEWCGNGPQCPLHDSILELRDHIDSYLKGTTLDVFAKTHVAPEA